MSSDSPTPLTTHHSPTALPYLILIAAQLAVGSAAILARTGLDAGLNAVSLAAWRLAIASAVIVAALRLRSRANNVTPGERLSRNQLLLIAMAGLCLGLHFAFWFASLQLVTVARSTLLVATSPLWAGLFGVLVLRHRLPVTFWLGLAIAGVGTYLVTQVRGPGSPPLAGHGPAWLGDMEATLGAVTIAFYLLLAESLQRALGSARLVAWTYTMAAITLVPIAAVTAGPQALVPRGGPAWFSILSMALLPQLIGHTAMNWSLRHFHAGVVGAATLLEPVFAALLAWWIFSEPVTGIQAVGAAILLLGVALALRKRQIPIIPTDSP